MVVVVVGLEGAAVDVDAVAVDVGAALAMLSSVPRLACEGTECERGRLCVSLFLPLHTHSISVQIEYRHGQDEGLNKSLDAISKSAPPPAVRLSPAGSSLSILLRYTRRRQHTTASRTAQLRETSLLVTTCYDDSRILSGQGSPRRRLPRPRPQTPRLCRLDPVPLLHRRA